MTALPALPALHTKILIADPLLHSILRNIQCNDHLLDFKSCYYFVMTNRKQSPMLIYSSPRIRSLHFELNTIAIVCFLIPSSTPPHFHHLQKSHRHRQSKVSY